jgi:hypothetical protein
MSELDWTSFNANPGKHGEEVAEGLDMDILAFDCAADHKIWACKKAQSAIQDENLLHTKNAKQEYRVAKI